MLQNSGMNCD